MTRSSKRLVIFSITWFAFWVAGAEIVYRIQDVAAPYWIMGVVSFPLIFGLFYVADRYLSRTAFGLRNSRTVMALLCLGGMLIYFPLLPPTLRFLMRLFG